LYIKKVVPELSFFQEDKLGNGGIAPVFLTSVIYRSGQLHTPCHWIEGWVGPIASLNAMDKRKVAPLLELKHQPTEISQL
jgi:hypothetical protein